MMQRFLRRWITAALLVSSTFPFTSANAEDGVSTVGVDQSPTKVHVQRAFPNLKIDRPILIMHDGARLDRLIIGSQLGVIYSIANQDSVETADTFMDISDRVVYDDRQNEEGLLGLAFHPKFKENGEFFVYYTSTKEPQLSVISRFKTKDGDRSQGDPASEEVLMTIKQPFWNHNGGTIVFGPDGYLYIGMGDGGFRNDPLLSGQDLSTWLGKILRIDVDHRQPDLPYAIPKDNPFIGAPNAKPEIYSLGWRNIWRMSFDRKNGDFWVADVGQELWEEINLVEKGSNHGWSLREAAHRFYQKDGDDVSKLIDPIWEYDHTVGKSITGGVVYRGTKVPSLQGKYVYADYVSGKLWALHYDAKSKKVTENRSIAWPPSLPVVTFGEDAQGEVYFSTTTSGGMIYRFVEGLESK